MNSEALEKITEKFCEKSCKFSQECEDQNELDDICDECPMNELTELLD